MAVAPSPIASGPHWQLDDVFITRVATEMAREMYSIPEILERFNLDTEVFRTRVRQHPAFERAYLDAKALWGSGSARERVAVKAGVLFEDWLNEANLLFHDRTQPLSSKVELLKQMAKVAGFEQSDKQSAIAPGDRVVVEINLGAGMQAPNMQPVAVTIDKIAPTIDLNAAPEPLPEWNTTPASPVPEPAVYEPEPPAPKAQTILPAQVTSKPTKLVPFVPAAK